MTAIGVSILWGGCMAWTPGWEDMPAAAQTAPAQHVDSLLAEADRMFEAGASREDLLTAITAYRRVLAAEPGHLRALARLGEAHILLGAAYAPNGAARARDYREGIQWCERAMATNPEFAARAAVGGMEAAIETLTAREYEAAFFWVTGVSFYFKECLRGPAVLFHLDWMKQTERLLKHLVTIDPDWGPGMVQFSLSIYYLGMPERYGGDMVESARTLERAITLAPNSLLMRWGRAKYFHRKQRDREGFRQDLAWVLAQDPDRAGSPRRWNLYFQRDAQAMLARIDDWF